ncbi:MAG: hypothetical protein M3Z59_05290 [Bombella apis]|nr:hypothetical protein [Bombella apis]
MAERSTFSRALLCSQSPLTRGLLIPHSDAEMMHNLTENEAVRYYFLKKLLILCGLEGYFHAPIASIIT